MIEINNNTNNKIDLLYLEKNILKVLNILGLKNKYISFAVVSKDEIHKMNLLYRNKDKETDVLSFPNVFIKNIWDFKKFPENDLGEIIVCYDVIKKQANEFKKEPKEEMLFLCIHGILHLLGFEDEKTEKEWKHMERWQNYLCEKIKISSR